MLKNLTLCLLLATANSALALSKPELQPEQQPAPSMLISGSIEAKISQIFSVPVANSWQVQIKWMAEEGIKVKAGDEVVIYDTASLSSEVEQKEAELRKAQSEAKRSRLQLELELEQAKFRDEKAKLDLEKAELEASVPEQLLSKLEFAQNQLKLKKAEQEAKEAALALTVKQEALDTDMQRHTLTLQGVSNQLQRAKNLFANMTQVAKSDGTVQYVDHPWNGTKIRSGDTVQRGFTVLKIPSTDNLMVQGWLNEVDVARVQPGDKVDILVDAIPDLKLKGVIEKISNQAEPRERWGESAYFSLGIRIDGETDARLIPGMSVVAQLRSAS